MFVQVLIVFVMLHITSINESESVGLIKLTFLPFKQWMLLLQCLFHMLEFSVHVTLPCALWSETYLHTVYIQTHKAFAKLRCILTIASQQFVLLRSST